METECIPEEIIQDNQPTSINEGFNKSLLDRWDLLLAISLGLLVFAVLLTQLNDPGITWDEASPSFPNAKSQAAWIHSLFSLPAPFSSETIDEYWMSSSDHPSLPRTIAALSYLILSPPLDEMAALRVPSALKFSLLLVSIFLFLRLFLPKTAALAGALSLALMPRVFGHAHLFSLDIPIMVWWFWTAGAAFLVMHGRLRPIWFGVVYALTFTTKLHSVFLPFPLLAWAAVLIFLKSDSRHVLIHRLCWAVGWAALLTPVIYIGLQPWLWHDTWTRIYERFLDYADKASDRPIPLYYFGNQYGKNTPWHYPLVMFAFTVPLSILFFFLWGFISPLCSMLRCKMEQNRVIILENGGVRLLLSLLFLTPLAIVLLPLAQAYDGCRLFLPCFPFAACLAGFGYHAVWTILKRSLRDVPSHSILLFILILPSSVFYVQHHPFYLSYYNQLAGGIRGSKELGMETTYWCDALTKDFLTVINETIPEGNTLQPLSMPVEPIQYYQKRGWLRSDLRPTGDLTADYFLLQCRQGMFRRQAEWILYKQLKPIASIEIDRVPLFLLYKNPQ